MARMFNPPHPGRMVAETLEYLGISAREFARHIGVAPSTVTRIIKEKSTITPEWLFEFLRPFLDRAPRHGLPCRRITTLGKLNIQLISPI